jgi:hypothetical protein
MAWSLATQFNVDNAVADQWFLYDHIFAKRWLIIHIESNEIPQTWESVGYAIPAYLLNNDALPGIDDSWVIGGDDRDNRYRLLPLRAQELIAPFEQGQAYRFYFRFVRYMRSATVSIYENDEEPPYSTGIGGTGVVLWSDIQGDKLYSDLTGIPDLSIYAAASSLAKIYYASRTDTWAHSGTPVDQELGYTDVNNNLRVEVPCTVGDRLRITPPSVSTTGTENRFRLEVSSNNGSTWDPIVLGDVASGKERSTWGFNYSGGSSSGTFYYGSLPIGNGVIYTSEHEGALIFRITFSGSSGIRSLGQINSPSYDIRFPSFFLIENWR